MCGTDGKTNNGKCQMKVTACLTNTDIKVAYDGQCRGQGGEFGLPPTTPPICTIHTCQGLLVKVLMGEMFLKIPED